MVSQVLPKFDLSDIAIKGEGTASDSREKFLINVSELSRNYDQLKDLYETYLYMLLYNLKDPAYSEAVLNKTLQKSLHKQNVYYHLALLHYINGDYDVSKNWCEKTIALDAESFDARLWAAYAVLAMDSTANINVYLNYMVNNHKIQAGKLFSISTVYSLMNKEEQFYKFFEMAIKQGYQTWDDPANNGLIGKYKNKRRFLEMVRKYKKNSIGIHYDKK